MCCLDALRWAHVGAGGARIDDEALATRISPLHYPRTTPPAYKNLQKIPKKILHLWKFPVISLLRTNFAEMPVESQQPGSRGDQLKGDAVVRVSRFEEEAIEIGNS